MPGTATASRPVAELGGFRWARRAGRGPLPCSAWRSWRGDGKRRRSRQARHKPAEDPARNNRRTTAGPTLGGATWAAGPQDSKAVAGTSAPTGGALNPWLEANLQRFFLMARLMVAHQQPLRA